MNTYLRYDPHMSPRLDNQPPAGIAYSQSYTNIHTTSIFSWVTRIRTFADLEGCHKITLGDPAHGGRDVYTSDKIYWKTLIFNTYWARYWAWNTVSASQSRLKNPNFLSGINLNRVITLARSLQVASSHPCSCSWNRSVEPCPQWGKRGRWPHRGCRRVTDVQIERRWSSLRRSSGGHSLWLWQVLPPCLFRSCLRVVGMCVWCLQISFNISSVEPYSPFYERCLLTYSKYHGLHILFREAPHRQRS